MTFTSISVILTGHYIADFVLQTRQMGENKSSSWYWLSAHVAVYTAALWFFALLVLGPVIAMLYVVINGAIHFGADAVTSRMTTRFHHAGKKKAFWDTIGFDQLIHQLTLLGTLSLVTA